MSPNDPNAWFNGQKPNNGQDPNVQNLPAQQPEVYNSPSLANVPYGAQPSPQPQAANAVRGKSNRLPLIIIGGLLAIFAVVALVTLLSNSSKKTSEAPVQQTSQGSEILKPADSIGIAEIDNSLSQDMSSLNDEKDFPAASLDDKTLGL